MAEKKLNFEQAMSRLEEIVAALEKGEAPCSSMLLTSETVWPVRLAVSSTMSRS